MACCGSSKNFENIDAKLKQLRSNKEIISLRLDNLKLNFDPEQKQWKSK